MSVGFAPRRPPPPPHEITLWVARKDRRHARALIRQHPLGRELVVMIGQDIGWSRLYRDHKDSRTLGEMAEGCRLDFERFGWVTAEIERTGAACDPPGTRTRSVCWYAGTWQPMKA